jgi:phage terminase small subunit
MNELNPKMMRFVVEYMKDSNGVQAAIRAGYTPTGAGTQASRLLKNVRIQQEIAKRATKCVERVELSAEKVLRDIEEVRALAVEKGRLNDALKALELQGKYLKLFTDKIDLGGQQDNPVSVSVVFVGDDESSR